MAREGPKTTREEATRILLGGFGQALHELAFTYVFPVAAFDPEIFRSSNDGGVHNDTGFIVNLGSGLIGITADHVVEKCLERAAAGAVCQLGDLRINLEERLIERDRQLDLATFRVAQPEVAMIKRDLVVYQPREAWPPHPPDRDRGVFLAGFPGEHRRHLGRGRIEWGTGHLILTATSISDSKITCQIRAEDMIPTIGDTPYESGRWLGGMSGAPLWTLVEGDVWWWRLAGIVFEYHQDFDLLMARRCDVVATDGRLIRSVC